MSESDYLNSSVVIGMFIKSRGNAHERDMPRSEIIKKSVVLFWLLNMTI